MCVLWSAPLPLPEVLRFSTKLVFCGVRVQSPWKARMWCDGIRCHRRTNNTRLGFSSLSPGRCFLALSAGTWTKSAAFWLCLEKTAVMLAASRGKLFLRIWKTLIIPSERRFCIASSLQLLLETPRFWASQIAVLARLAAIICSWPRNEVPYSLMHSRLCSQTLLVPKLLPHARLWLTWRPVLLLQPFVSYLLASVNAFSFEHGAAFLRDQKQHWKWDCSS